jgi:hypothetical protein
MGRVTRKRQTYTLRSDTQWTNGHIGRVTHKLSNVYLGLKTWIPPALQAGAVQLLAQDLLQRAGHDAVLSMDVLQFDLG